MSDVVTGITAGGPEPSQGTKPFRSIEHAVTDAKAKAAQMIDSAKNLAKR